MKPTKTKNAASFDGQRGVGVSDRETTYGGNSTTEKGYPLKSEAVIEAFLEHGDLNTIEAGNIYGETCLHSSVSDLFRRYRLLIPRRDDFTVPRAWTPKPFKRYYVTDEIRPRMESILAQLRADRGEP